jgi:hypothetical protein
MKTIAILMLAMLTLAPAMYALQMVSLPDGFVTVNDSFTVVLDDDGYDEYRLVLYAGGQMDEVFTSIEPEIPVEGIEPGNYEFEIDGL